ncbi:hypothetical protein EKH77_26990 [Streptomyces luteoverticillatus]|uniref:Uncharacterized protein n=1 Tax=Streptomyces luteoverticillatus TaxID=66425 RepID=A0A3Q9G389_STRLT|nr:hypothetical protein [Streptomyces luteoverticillatus]AZQ74371.1 hypothetical protein EKH77_26990 [Streptomyces luteoverticillatus]
MASVFLSQSERIERLRAQLQGRPATEQARRLAAAPRDTSLLYGVLLRGAARLDAGMELTDLEARLLVPLGHLLSEEEIREAGRVFAEESSVRHAPELFPQTLAARPLDEGYSVTDLIKDLPQMEDVSAQANVNVVDIGAGEGDECLAGEEFGRVVEEAGYGLTLVTSSAPAEQPTAALHARILLDRFHCVDATNGESGKDEIYWALSSGSDGGGKRAHRTGEYGAINTGDWATFRTEDKTLFDGSINNSVACHIACWEADDSTSGFYDEMGRKLRIISDELAKFSNLIGDLPAGQWENMAEWIMLGSMIVRLIEELIAWLRNDDDFIQEHTIVFDRAAIAVLATQPDKTRSLDFVGDGGVFRLYMKWAGPNPKHTVALFSGGRGTWLPPVQAWPGSATPSAPALAVHDSKLYCAVRGFDDQIWVSRRDGTTWTRFAAVSGHGTHHAPALASFNGRLYLAHTGRDGSSYVTTSTNGADWSAPVRVATAGSTAPTLAVRNGALVYAFGHGLQIYFTYSSNGTSWQPLAAVPGLGVFAGLHAPALATLQNKLHLAYRDPFGGNIQTTVHNGTSWSAPTRLAGTTPDGPALAVRGSNLYCAIRGHDSNIWFAGFDGAGWGGFQKTPTVITLTAPAIAAPNTDDLYFAYGSADF